MRLHDIEGALLNYYNQNKRLPRTLDELANSPLLEEPGDLTCPVSKRAYVYNPVGIQTPDKQPRIIVYDAAPSHSGRRWAISIVEPQEAGGPLVTHLYHYPESAFTLKAPAR